MFSYNKKIFKCFSTFHFYVWIIFSNKLFVLKQDTDEDTNIYEIIYKIFDVALFINYNYLTRPDWRRRLLVHRDRTPVVGSDPQTFSRETEFKIER